MKENNELTRDDIAIDHDMEVDCDEGREITVYTSTGGRSCRSPKGWNRIMWSSPPVLQLGTKPESCGS